MAGVTKNVSAISTYTSLKSCTHSLLMTGRNINIFPYLIHCYGTTVALYKCYSVITVSVHHTVNNGKFCFVLKFVLSQCAKIPVAQNIMDTAEKIPLSSITNLREITC
ncbi:hypothetical protein OTU49_009444 [Cherax quadricarinatus]|uniref:Uncharacterized protein n=1 Tax=Cherax quadricarinatus TaxID=27406 RepID=A0AAW0YIG7_CHEQU